MKTSWQSTQLISDSRLLKNLVQLMLVDSKCSCTPIKAVAELNFYFFISRCQWLVHSIFPYMPLAGKSEFTRIPMWSKIHVARLIMLMHRLINLDAITIACLLFYLSYPDCSVVIAMLPDRSICGCLFRAPAFVAECEGINHGASQDLCIDALQSMHIPRTGSCIQLGIRVN